MVGILPVAGALGAAGLLVPPTRPQLKLGLLGAGAAALAWWWSKRGAGYAGIAATTIGGLAQSLAGLPAELAEMNEQGVGYALTPAGRVGQEIVEQRELIRELERAIALDVAATGEAHPTKLAVLARYKRNLTTLEKQYAAG
jgi:hypothetical protein